MSKSSYRRTLKEILDSDEELTIDHVEASCPPAYLDDTRFEYVELKKKRRPTKSKSQMQAMSFRSKNLKNGILSKMDTFCLLCLQKLPKDTLLWLFKFLIYKDLHSNYKFLKSCLVPTFEYYYSDARCEAVSMCKFTQGQYKIVINKNN